MGEPIIENLEHSSCWRLWRWPWPASAQTGSAAPRWDSLEALGNTRVASASYVDAIAWASRAIDQGQKDAGPAAIGRLYTALGKANLKLRKNDAAVAAYTKAAAIDPHPAVAYFNL